MLQNKHASDYSPRHRKPAGYVNSGIRRTTDDQHWRSSYFRLLRWRTRAFTDRDPHSSRRVIRYRRKMEEKFRGKTILPVFLKTGDQSSYRQVEEAGYKLL